MTILIYLMQALMGICLTNKIILMEADFNNFEDNDEELQTNFGCEECKTFTLVYQVGQHVCVILD